MRVMLVVVLALGLLAGCGKKKKAADTGAAPPAATESGPAVDAAADPTTPTTPEPPKPTDMPPVAPGTTGAGSGSALPRAKMPSDDGGEVKGKMPSDDGGEGKAKMPSDDGGEAKKKAKMPSDDGGEAK